MSERQSPAFREEADNFPRRFQFFFFLYVKDSFRIYRKSFCFPALQGVEETLMTDHTATQRVLNYQVRYLLQGRTEIGSFYCVRQCVEQRQICLSKVKQ